MASDKPCRPRSPIATWLTTTHTSTNTSKNAKPRCENYLVVREKRGLTQASWIPSLILSARTVTGYSAFIADVITSTSVRANSGPQKLQRFRKKYYYPLPHPSKAKNSPHSRLRVSYMMWQYDPSALTRSCFEIRTARMTMWKKPMLRPLESTATTHHPVPQTILTWPTNPPQ